MQVGNLLHKWNVKKRPGLQQVANYTVSQKNGPTLKQYSSEILTINFDVILQKYSKVSRTEFA